MIKINKITFIVVFIIISALLVLFVPSHTGKSNSQPQLEKNITQQEKNTKINKLDTSDAKNYVDFKIPEANEFPRVKNVYYTMIDVIAWQLETYPNFELIGKESEKIMKSTLCLVSHISSDSKSHVAQISHLLIVWQPSYIRAMNEINDYLSKFHQYDIPSKNNIQEYCSVFDEYPAKGYEFLYTSGDSQ